MMKFQKKSAACDRVLEGGGGNDGNFDDDSIANVSPNGQTEPIIEVDEEDESSNGNSSSKLDTTSFGSSKEQKTSEGDKQTALARNENNAVRIWRVVTFLVLLTVAVLSCVGVYFYTYNEQVHAFRLAFDSNGHMIIRSFQNDAQRKLQALHSLSQTLTNYGLQNKQRQHQEETSAASNNATTSSTSATTVWPFVTVENSARILEPYLSLADAASIQILPIIPKTMRAEWEAYSVQNQHWVEKDLVTRDIEAQEKEHENENYDQEQHSTEHVRRRLQQQQQEGNQQPSTAEGSGIIDSVHNILNSNSSSASTTSSQLDATTENATATSSSTSMTHDGHFENMNYIGTARSRSESISPYIQNYVGIDTSPGPHVVWWQYAPVIANRFFVNFNMRQSQTSDFDEEVRPVITDQRPVVSKSFTIIPGLDEQSTRDFDFWDELLRVRGAGRYGTGEPISFMYYPVVESYEHGTNGSDIGEHKTVALLAATVYWKSYFENILTEDVKGMVAVVKNTQGQVFTYQVNGKESVFLGMEDAHDPRYDHMTMRTEYVTEDNTHEMTTRDDGSGTVLVDSSHSVDEIYRGSPLDTSHISYTIQVYASADMQVLYVNNNPILYTCAMMVLFLVTAGIFILYDILVERRQQKVYTTAVRSTAVVESLFPKNVRERLYEEAAPVKKSTDDSAGAWSSTQHSANSGNMDISRRSTASRRNLPIADFFPDTTVFFADIRGFTAWCSTREPTQVFSLLETVYNAFDDIAKRRRIFKVETVGDCYMAVAGLPDPRKDHAVAMARFARDAMFRFSQLVKELELALGPDTGELGIRCGLHSGAVTGGVIRGENARFQLFGDTVNTAARMESTGEVHRIQISQETADLLKIAGKESWYVPREEVVYAKGKGSMTTYWLHTLSGSDGTKSNTGTDRSYTEDDATEVSFAMDASISAEDRAEQRKVARMTNEKTIRLIRWNVDLLVNLLRQIVAHREASGAKQLNDSELNVLEENHSQKNYVRTIEEVKEIIMLPNHDISVDYETIDQVQLDHVVIEQLLDYVGNIAAMYNDNPFHSFEHASHVTMSVQKLLARIVAPSSSAIEEDKTLHDHTYGITSDPITQFSCVLSALIHDTDHTGVPNAQLVKEKAKIAQFYQGKSVAEQNSVDLAWNLLMDDNYRELRATIYRTEAEFLRFRQLVVNTVMATDIVDKDLKALRNKRWECAFAASPAEEDPLHVVNRKATIVIEHLIQASDVAHTMQHWHIYRKWNERFFMECYKAFQQGRAESDPSESWYKGEIGFFDFYIIPLAKKLKECGVFGVSSDEYLNYALKNRQEWESRGMEVVSEMKEKALKEKIWDH